MRNFPDLNAQLENAQFHYFALGDENDDFYLRPYRLVFGTFAGRVDIQVTRMVPVTWVEDDFAWRFDELFQQPTLPGERFYNSWVGQTAVWFGEDWRLTKESIDPWPWLDVRTMRRSDGSSW